jgi:hypothetical protein
MILSRFTRKSHVVALTLAALSTAAFAQDPAPLPTQPPAPIVHRYAPDQPSPPPRIALTSPAAGVWVRSAPGAEVKTVSSTGDSIELAVTKGLVNIMLRQPKENEQILVDLPGGQVALFKDGVYTFNAATSTFRVLQGEAAAYPAADANAKPLTVKEDHAVVFGAGNLRTTEFAPFQARADILPAGPDGRVYEPGYYYGPGYYGREYAYGPYGYWGPYGDGFYAAPYYAWGYPYAGWGGWGYPYGYGFGIGFGYGFGGYRGFRR